MPMDNITTMQDLLAAAVDFGNEVVDAEMNEKNVEFHYLDQNSVERRVGAKTHFADVARARVSRCHGAAHRRTMPSRHWSVTESQDGAARKRLPHTPRWRRLRGVAMQSYAVL